MQQQDTGTTKERVEIIEEKKEELLDCIGQVHAKFCRPERRAKRMHNTLNQAFNPPHALQRGSFNLRRQHKYGTFHSDSPIFVVGYFESRTTALSQICAPSNKVTCLAQLPRRRNGTASRLQSRGTPATVDWRWLTNLAHVGRYAYTGGCSAALNTTGGPNLHADAGAHPACSPRWNWFRPAAATQRGMRVASTLCTQSCFNKNRN